MKHSILLSLLSGVIFALMGCNGGPGKTNIELNQNMMDQVNIKSQDWNPNHPDEVQMRQPPVGAISRGHAPYKFLKDPAAAEKEPNPLAGNMSPEVLTLGQKKFEIYCSVCHGATLHSDTPVAEKMAVKPRILASDEAKAYSDGRIFYAITAGKGVMGSYAGQIPEAQDRWAVVNYVRSLQKSK